MVVQSRRERIREATFAEIKGIARQQMAEQGAGNLSLRKLAEQMGVAAPSLYNYYKSRDELVTALIADAYNAQAQAMEEAVAKRAENDFGGRLFAGLMAYRDWAVAHPTEFALIYGDPIPGYQAPSEITSPAAFRGRNLMLHLLHEAWQAGQVRVPPEFANLPPDLVEQLEQWRQRNNLDIPVAVLHLLLHSWAHGQGLLTLEIYNHFQAILPNPGTLYRFEVLAMLKRLGLTVQE